MTSSNSLARSTRGITATAAEVNAIAGGGLSSTELGILDGATVTTAELNILDGVTATASELNLLDASAATGVAIGVATGTLTASEINDLKDTNITAIAAPAAGRAIVPLAISLVHDHGGTDFVQDAGSDHLALKYSGAAEIGEIGTEAQCTAFWEAAADALLVHTFSGAYVPTAATAVVFDNNGATDSTTGDGEFDYTITYLVVPAAA